MSVKHPKPRDGSSSYVVWVRQTTRSRAHLQFNKLPNLKNSPKAALAPAEPGNANPTSSYDTSLNTLKMAALTAPVCYRKSIGTRQKCVYTEGSRKEGPMPIYGTTIAHGTF